MFDNFWILLAMTIAMLLVLEGMMPFLMPTQWKEMLKRFLALPERTIRITGLLAMLVGLGIMFGIHHIVLH